MLTLKQGSRVFQAQIEPGRDVLHSLRDGSLLEVTGICLIEAGGLWNEPESFHVLLRSPEDIVVLRRA
ncbi:MAG: hypothetical protein DMG57_34405 [Acidobacteria bacterium]|nr:MAG: hypothetical protein DMG57_34405 [Acidobacteriota bacterium]